METSEELEGSEEEEHEEEEEEEEGSGKFGASKNIFTSPASWLSRIMERSGRDENDEVVEGVTVVAFAEPESIIEEECERCGETSPLRRMGRGAISLNTSRERRFGFGGMGSGVGGGLMEEDWLVVFNVENDDSEKFEEEEEKGKDGGEIKEENFSRRGEVIDEDGEKDDMWEVEGGEAGRAGALSPENTFGNRREEKMNDSSREGTLDTGVTCDSKSSPTFIRGGRGGGGIGDREKVDSEVGERREGGGDEWDRGGEGVEQDGLVSFISLMRRGVNNRRRSSLSPTEGGEDSSDIVTGGKSEEEKGEGGRGERGGEGWGVSESEPPGELA